MVRAISKLLLACTTFAAGALASEDNARAQGPERPALSTQPVEVWSRAMSGLGSADVGCQPALPAWQLRETVDPWASTRAPCEASVRERVPFVASVEIIDPWPAHSDTLRPAIREIIDPWAPMRK